mmetsp:Transcript_9771/g.59398  ORF Transcript_9771/g.59398 Transcript_9771/m.59398 type:complete len:463 (-) Transcript_9771:1666-3054(-)
MGATRATHAMTALRAAVWCASRRDLGLARVPTSWDAAAAAALRTRNRRRVRAHVHSEDVVSRSKDDAAVAHAASRAPLAYASARRALEEVKRRKPHWKPQDVLCDVAKVGEGLLAVVEAWPTVRRAIAVESDEAMARLGDQLLRRGDKQDLAVRWLKSWTGVQGPFDVVVGAFAASEDVADVDARVDALWENTKDVMVLLEKGNAAGFDAVLHARTRILARGDGHVLAPCAHEGKCPLQGGSRRCRVSQRVERAQAQRLALGANRTYGDASFSYVILQRGERMKPRRVEPDPTLWEALEREGIQAGPYGQLKHSWKPHVEELLALGETLENGTAELRSQAPFGDAVAEGGEAEATQADDERSVKRRLESAPVVQSVATELGANSEEWGRMVELPRKRSKHVRFHVCRPCKDQHGNTDFQNGELVEHILTKAKHHESKHAGYSLYRQARKSSLGDLWPFPMRG